MYIHCLFLTPFILFSRYLSLIPSHYLAFYLFPNHNLSTPSVSALSFLYLLLSIRCDVMSIQGVYCYGIDIPSHQHSHPICIVIPSRISYRLKSYVTICIHIHLILSPHLISDSFSTFISSYLLIWSQTHFALYLHRISSPLIIWISFHFISSHHLRSVCSH